MLCGGDYDESCKVSMSDSGIQDRYNPLGSHELMHLNDIGDASHQPLYSHNNGLRVHQSHTRTYTNGDTYNQSGHSFCFSSAIDVVIADADIDGAVHHAQYRSDSGDSSKLDLRKDQRVLIELAEVGLIHSFDNEMNVDAVEYLMDDSNNSMGVSGTDFIGVEVDSGNACTSSDGRNIIKKEGWRSVTERFQSNRADDEICSSIRCMVRAAKDARYSLCFVFSASLRQRYHAIRIFVSLHV